MASIHETHKKPCSNVPSTDKQKNIGHFVFFSSDGFNQSDRACLSQMSLYEPCEPSPLPIALSPHIKKYFRLLNGKTGEDDDDHNDRGEGSNYLAWMMLSSACLSRGAQGFTMKKRSDHNLEQPPTDNDERVYSNFELGVLFVSRLQGNPDTDVTNLCMLLLLSLLSSSRD